MKNFIKLISRDNRPYFIKVHHIITFFMCELNNSITRVALTDGTEIECSESSIEIANKIVNAQNGTRLSMSEFNLHGEETLDEVPF